MAEGRFQEVFGEYPLPPLPEVSLRLPDFHDAPEAASRAAEADVTFVAAGSVGLAAILAMARLAPGTIRVIDPGEFKPESLLTHPVLPEDVGKAKALVAGRMAKRISPSTRVLVYFGPIQSLSPAQLMGTHITVLASDRLSCERDTGQVMASLGIPLIQASVHGETLVVQLRQFTNGGEGPCPRCLYNAAEEELLRSETVLSCDGTSQLRPSSPTRSLAALCWMAGTMGALRAIRHVLEVGRPMQDCIVEYCGYTNQMVTSVLRRRADCPTQHQPWRRLQLSQALAGFSLADLAAAACSAADADVMFEVEGHSFAVASVCGCGFRAAARFVDADRIAGICAVCGQKMRAPLSHDRPATVRNLPAELLLRPLGELLPSGAAWVVLRSGSSTWFAAEDPWRRDKP